MIGGQVNLADAVRGTIEHEEDGKHYELDDEVATLLVRPRGWHLVERHLLVDGEPRGRRAGGLRPVRLPQRPRAARARRRAVLLPAEDGVTPRGAPVERRLRPRRGAHRPGARHDQGDRPDRDAPGRVRDGRDPLRAARALGGPERRPLGLHLLGDQALPHAPGVRHAGPQAGHDDRAVHARLHRAAREDLPPARRARDGRHGGADPQPHRRAGQRDGLRRAARGQAARGRRRLRRHLGGAPGLGGRGDGGVRRGARRPAAPGRPAARRRRR